MTPGLRLVPIAVLALWLPFGCRSGPAEQDPGLRLDGESIVVDLEEVERKGGSFYTYVTAGGVKVDFLVYRDSAGTVRSVLDACKKCYRWRRGYTFDGEHVVCRKCGERYEVDTLHEGRGSCIPIPLTSVQHEHTVRIPASELEDAAAFF